ncbi:hypothetical protein EUTSA_v10019438mg [Eutrema salsugineum]|uniref:UBC core domain-containing protein n=1 Tax=Eutrema salsugineum TaxID=72664 RepID=V4KFP6_EUTSA|nr:ubiquitin-conjugating enzyme E2 11 [Eutrema salsugineum]ESQ28642.1 hypothetical protein EUTSA_v10019438mg [Eutrema salsugineum]
MAPKTWIMTHLRELLRFPVSGFGAGPVAEDIYEWQETLLGPPSKPYEGGIFFISIHVPSEYPFKPPMVSWKTLILHPNIDMLLHPKVEEEDNYLADVARMCILEPERFKKEARLMTEAHAMD